jgi:hypothetical protein
LTNENPFDKPTWETNPDLNDTGNNWSGGNWDIQKAFSPLNSVEDAVRRQGPIV